MDRTISHKIPWQPATDIEKFSTEIVRKLQNAGFPKTYFAGGTVRDILLHTPPKDVDITTEASPEDVARFLQSERIDYFDDSAKYGTLKFIRDGFKYEIATFRQEKYAGEHRPDWVKFIKDPAEDAQRRDFTINALFLDPVTATLIDYVGGIDDLTAKVIRFVGEPRERIMEDPLRLLRAVRFHVQLGFPLAAETSDAVGSLHAEIARISWERIRDEIEKILQTKHRADGIEILKRTGLLRMILPEVDILDTIPQDTIYHQEGNVYSHTLMCIETLPIEAPLVLVWAVLLHDVGKASTTTKETREGIERITSKGHAEEGVRMAHELGARLRLSNDTVDVVSWLIKYHLHLSVIPEMRIGKQKRLALEPAFPLLIKVFKADTGGIITNDEMRDEFNKNIAYAEELYTKTILEQADLKKKLQFINGTDVIKEAQITPGPIVGKILHEIEEKILDGNITSREQALEEIKKMGKTFQNH